MCGFFISFNSDQSSISKRIKDILGTRGSDQVTELRVGGWHVIFSRLEICGDGPSYQQPVWTSGGHSFSVLNGQIYNYRHLKDIYSLPDYFNDTQVCHWLIENYGFDVALTKLNGMFAIAHVNTKTQNICFATDVYSQKPLYFFEDNSRILMASNINCIKEILKPRACEDAARIYLASDETVGTRGYFLPGKTMFSSIKSSVGGSIYSKDLSLPCSKLEKKSFTPSPVNRRVETSSFFAESMCKVLYDYVHEAGTGLFFSGGVDSTLLLYSLLHGGYDKSIDVVTKVARGCDWEANESFDSLNFGSWRSKHKLTVTAESYLENAREFIRCSGFPMRWGTAPSLMPLYEKMKELGVKVVLLGDGADELWGGYGRRDRLFFDTSIGAIPKNFQDFLKRHTFSGVSETGYEMVQHYFEQSGDIQKFNEAKERNDLTGLFKLAKDIDLNVFFKTIAAPNSDAIAGMYGIEARSPFLDFRLNPIDKPVDLEIYKGDMSDFSGNRDKPILRKALGLLCNELPAWKQFPKVGTRNFFTATGKDDNIIRYVDITCAFLGFERKKIFHEGFDEQNKKRVAKYASLGLFLETIEG